MKKLVSICAGVLATIFTQAQVTMPCATVNRIPKVTAANTLGCSDIFENAALNVGIGNTAPAQKLHVTGNMTATGFITAQSATTGFCLTAANTRVLAQSPCLGVGYSAGLLGLNNTSVGVNAGQNSLAGSGYNTSVGVDAGRQLQNSQFNTCVGYLSGQSVTGSVVNEGYANTMVGARSGMSTTTGGYNVFVGQKAGAQNTTGTRNIAVGCAWTGSGLGTGPLSGALENTGAFGFAATLSTSHTQRFGNCEVLRWGFGVDPVAVNKVVQVDVDGCGGIAPAYMDLGGVWFASSDRNLKTNITELDGAAVLAKLDELPMYEWSYAHQSNVKHYGPMAQDFYATFKLGNDDVSISTVDPAGVALASIKGLNNIVENQGARVSELAEKLAMALNRIAELEREQLAQGKDLRACCEQDLKAGEHVLSQRSKPELFQNTPNPFNETTTIRYGLPEQCGKCAIEVMDTNGRIVSTFNNLSAGQGQLMIAAGALSAGSYTYTMIVNGERADSKTMVITR